MKKKSNTIFIEAKALSLFNCDAIWAVATFDLETVRTAVRILGALDICAIPVLIFTSIRKRTDKSDSVK